MAASTMQPPNTAAGSEPGVNGMDGAADPFTSTPTTGQRFEAQLLSNYVKGSPSQAKRALEAHISDTDRRIRDASKLGTTLLEQKQQLLDRLVEVEEHADTDELRPELRQKLVQLEKEYNEVGREAARASLYKAKRQSRDFAQEINSSMSKDAVAGEEMSASGRTSPTKLQVPSASSSRRAKNQSSTSVKDLELATEISTSLLGEVRSLQVNLAEKEEALKRAQRENTELHSHMENLGQRIRGVDDNEQHYKDENWNLETQVQDLTNHIREISTREEKLIHSLNVAKAEKSTADREYEELKQSHGKLSEEQASIKRQHDVELSTLRRNMSDGESEREKMQRNIDELTSQNQDLAKAVAYRVKTEGSSREVEEPIKDGAEDDGFSTPEGSPPPSPNKFATPRHGALESETLKSSLTHAHRMIQNLKNNIHREKTEKVELKRMLQEARDDLESRRGDGGVATANAGRKRRPAPGQDTFKKPGSLNKLGGAKTSTEEILNDPSWEEYSADTPIRKSIEKDHDLSTDASDAFETADERNTTDDTDAFETGAESMAGDSEDDLTETETDPAKRTPSGSMRRSFHRHRNSYQSTASDEAEDTFDTSTPPASAPRYKLKVNNRLSRSITPGNRASPAPSFMSNQSQPISKQNLAAELEDMDSMSLTSSASATPARSIASSLAQTPEPSEMSRRHTMIRSPTAPRSAMVDSGMLTDPWRPEPEHETAEVGAAAGAGATVGAVGAALKSLVTPLVTTQESPAPEEKTPKVAEQMLCVSDIRSESTAPIAPRPAPAPATPAVPPVPASHAVPNTPKKAEVERPVLTAVSPNVPRTPGTRVAYGQTQKPDVFVPPRVASINKNNTLAPSTQAFLNDILNKAHSRTKSQPQARSNPSTPERSAKAAMPESGAISTPRRKTVSSNENDRPEGRPSFTISIEGRRFAQNAPTDATPSDVSRTRTGSLLSTSRTQVDENEDFEYSRPSLRWQEAESRADGSFREPTLSFGSPTDDDFDRSQTAIDSTTTTPITRVPEEPEVFSRPSGTGMTESGTQTSVSGEQIENLVKSNRKSLSSGGFGTLSNGSPRQVAHKNGGRAMSLGSTTDPNFLKTLKRPGSTGGFRRPASPPPAVPPLPADHREVIAAAANRSSSMLNMPPPVMSASALKMQQQPQQQGAGMRGPSNASNQASAKSVNTGRNRTSSIARSEMSRRSSVSSFASELDVRFNISTGMNRSSQNLLGDGFEGHGTDPRMIQAITQTMIGEFLWKYVRKTGRGEHSDNRHRRFFWIHPYTKTLYWSNQDPSVGGRSELKAKSVAIEAVRVVTDENPLPPGLHQKSIIVVTPGRSIKFTAPTSYRHETWFNALSYLLLRTGADGEGDIMHSSKNYSNVSGSQNDRSNTMNSTITAEDLAEFNPTMPYNRAGSRVSQRSNMSRTSVYAAPTLAAPGSLHSPNRVSTPQGVSSSSLVRPGGKRQSYMSSAPDLSPLRSNPIAPIDESEASRRPSASKDRPATAGTDAAASEVDADGFKKPRAPKSKTGNKLPKDASPSKPADSPGRLASLTAKLRRKSRAKSTTDGAEAKAPSGASAGHTHEHGADGAGLENVRACCDGKHDIGDLHGHSHVHGLGSRHSSMTSRTWSMQSRY